MAIYAFDEKAARRIVAGIKRTEGTDLTTTGRNNTPPPNQCITAKLLTQAGDKYAWEQVRRTPTGWETISGGLTGTTTERQAWQLDPEASSDLTNTVVTLVRVAGKDSEGNYIPLWIIVGLGATLPQPQYARMVIQAVTQNQIGADWLRGHDEV